jgi:hypothetical protein
MLSLRRKTGLSVEPVRVRRDGRSVNAALSVVLEEKV